MQVDAVAGSDGAEHGETAQEEQIFVDPLDKFLPPPPSVKCSENLQVSSIRIILQSSINFRDVLIYRIELACFTPLPLKEKDG